MRPILLALALVLALTAPARAEERGVLAATTTVQGLQDGYVPVTLDRDLILDLTFGKGNTRANGTGGFLLRREGSGESVPGIVGDVVAKDGSVYIQQIVDGADPKAYKLPAGDYRLYLFARDEGSRVTLSLPGLSGEQTFTPLYATPVRSGALPRRDVDAQANLSIWGAGEEMRSEGMVVVVAGVIAFNSVFQRAELCMYAPGSDAGALDAYTPGCPKGESYAYSNVVRADGTTVWFPFLVIASWSRFGVKAGTWGLGANAESISPGAGSVAAAAWMDFDGPRIPGAELPRPPAPAPAAVPPAKAKPKAKAKPAKRCSKKRKRTKRCRGKRRR